MALEAFLSEQGYRLHYTDDEVKLEKKLKINITSIIVGGIGIGIFVMLGSWLKDSAILMYVISAIILLIVLRFNYRGARPITIFDWSHDTMIRKSVWFFLNSQSVKINGYTGIDLRTTDWSSQSSEGVDEYQKTIFLKTADGEVDVVDFYTEEEDTEPELKEIMQILHDFLIVKKD
jgi:hypothetical protein